MKKSEGKNPAKRTSAKRIALIIAVIAVIAAAVFGLYLFSIAPSLRRPDLSAFTDNPVAHRGLYDNESDAPENSLAAFRLARDANLGVELDLHLTSDGGLAVIHDDTLMRACGIDKAPEEMTLAELKELKLFGSEERLPSFSDALALLNESPVPLIVDIKTTSSDVTLLCEKIAEALTDYRGEYAVESFNPLAVAYFKKHYPEIIRGQLADAFTRDAEYRGSPKYFALHHMLMNFLSRPDFIAYNFSRNDTVSMFFARRLFDCPIADWTVRTEGEYESCDGAVRICEGEWLRARYE